MEKKASAVWTGTLKEGQGTVSTQSGALSNAPYGFNTRFEGVKGTNPEELIGAAHAGCFSMALSAQLGNANLKPEKIETTATVTLEKLADGFTITAVHLDVTASIPSANNADFEKAVQAAKSGCPVSKLLNAKISVNATLQT
ncbi:MAG: OsmC family protein [Candidatus Omnitrophica bacterium]|nr:OsmC family protein [Candidatus Omnitrophota bacterium]